MTSLSSWHRRPELGRQRVELIDTVLLAADPCTSWHTTRRAGVQEAVDTCGNCAIPFRERMVSLICTNRLSPSQSTITANDAGVAVNRALDPNRQNDRSQSRPTSRRHGRADHNCGLGRRRRRRTNRAWRHGAGAMRVLDRRGHMIASMNNVNSAHRACVHDGSLQHTVV